MHKIAQILLVCLLFVVVVPTARAAPTDTWADAHPAVMGHNSGSFAVYNDKAYYNFTANAATTYNFSLFNGAGDDMSIYIYDTSGTLLAKNFTLTPTRTILLSGQSKYTIGLYASEFTNSFPTDYDLIISIPGGTTPNLENATNIGSSCVTGVFHQYNDIDYYNFTADATLTYDFSIYRDNSSDINLYVYSSDYQLLASNWSLGPINLITQGGHSKYIISVHATEFINFPQEYSLCISPHETTAPPVVIERRQVACFSGNFSKYNDYAFYNITTSPYRTYEFSVHRNESAYLGLFVYNQDDHLLEGNWSLGPDNTIIATGQAGYHIKVTSSEFVVCPQNYSLCVTELIRGDLGTSLARARQVETGSFNEAFTTQDSTHWFNFTGSAQQTYDIFTTQSTSAVITLQIFDSSMKLLTDHITTQSASNVTVSGHTNYVIAVHVDTYEASQLDYMLVIRQHMQTGGSTSSSTTENPSSNGFQLDFPWMGLLAMFLPIIPLRKKYLAV